MDTSKSARSKVHDSVVELIPSVCKILGLILSITYYNNNNTIPRNCTYVSGTGEIARRAELCMRIPGFAASYYMVS